MATVEQAKRKRPTIIHFQPSGRRRVTGEPALTKFAADVKRFTGIHLDVIKGAAAGNAYYETLCGQKGEYDDCSEEDPGEQLEF